MKYYLIVGEASGDLHGANLMKSILKEDPEAEFRFWGGDLMQSVGGTMVLHYKERAFMGFFEVILNLFKILGFIKQCKKDIEQYNPDALILIDNSGFNLRIAEWAKPKGYLTHYYISPQVWASRAGRVKTIKANVDHMYVILPFVSDFYKKYDYEVNFVGHPLIDAIADHTQVMPDNFKKQYHLDERPIIAILPGSRKQEIRKMLEVMLSVVDDFPSYQFVIAGAPSQDEKFYEPFIKKEGVHLIMNRTYDVLSLSNAALVTSGTATLETALFKVPQVVCYKGNTISYHIAKRIINLEYISLVNLIMDKPVVKELIQGDFNKKQLKEELTKILDDYKRAVMFLEYYDLEKKLGGKGASDKTANLIVETIK
ncbi:lipid-A-disaccharide synthase [Aquimarina sp. AD1]|uniref:lipid-A-disaccharide synthase n=1 Tax=Aquimarina TaxID=290174 RepID=UPI00041C16E9|nr:MULTISPECIES: lipid-A-disaccharide synthase [Aquimarina]AXT57725.1 lipid-A-disaccharide synthase [Aquimarina sp. AD1]RKN17683.1 lipid-A-disaccharide synthase [Aquimarina sp. AD1]